MKHKNNQLTTTSAHHLKFYLPNDLISNIAKYCHPTTRISWSLVNKLFNQLTSIRNKDGAILLNNNDRLYYLFYGCIHNLENLVGNVLSDFNLEDFSERETLAEVKYQIKKLINTDAVKLLNHCPELSYGQHPLIWISHENDLELAKLIIHNSNIPTEDNYDDITTPLHILISNNNLEMIKLLRKHTKININIQNMNGDTPLHWAVAKNNLRVVNFLLTHSNINLNILNNHMLTPFLLAQKINQNLTNFSNLQEPKILDHNWIKNMKIYSKKLQKNLAIIRHLREAHGWND